MRTVAVTGGDGYVGRHVISALREQGDEVRVLSVRTDDAADLEGQGVVVHRGDVRDPSSLCAPLKGVDAVVHLAGLMGVCQSIGEYRAVNVTGTLNVCRAALAEQARVVHASSWTVYGMGLQKAVSEDFPLRPLREPYAVSKAEGDLAVQRMIREEGLQAVIIRPGTVFGPGNELNFGRIVDRMRAGRWLIVGTGSNALPLVYITDVVQGLLLALDEERAFGEAYNIGNDCPLTQEQFFSAIAEETGMRAPRWHVPYAPLFAAARAVEQVAACGRCRHTPLVTRHGVALFGTDNRHSLKKARSELGYVPRVELRNGVGLAATWYLDARTDRTALATSLPVTGSIQ